MDGTVICGYDTDGHGTVKLLPQGIADDDGPLAHLDLVAVSQLHRLQADAGDQQHGDVKRLIGDDQLGFRFLGAEGHCDAAGTLDDVIVGQDVAVLADHDAGARAPQQFSGGGIGFVVVAEAKPEIAETVSPRSDHLVIVDADDALSNAVGNGQEGAFNLGRIGRCADNGINLLLGQRTACS